MVSPGRALGALLREMRPDFGSWRGAEPRKEVASGVAGAVLAIPQAITYAYLAGLAPEYGIYCAVFVAFISSLFGNSALVGGPNTALSILIGISILPYAGRGSPLYTDYALLLTLMVGLMQLALWLLRAADLFRYLSPAAITGIKTGVGVLLITSALEGSLGVSGLAMQFFYEKFIVVVGAWDEIVNPNAAWISGATIASALLLKRRFPRAYILLALAVGALVGALIDGWVGPVRSQIEMLGRMPYEPLPLRWPTFSREHLMVMQDLLPAAFAIAVLGLAQSLVIARDLGAQSPHVIDLHKEAFAQGLSNLAGPFFSAFAGSGSFNRTSVAVEMGARSPLSGLVAAVVVMLMAWGLGPWLSPLPMPAIAAVLALVGLGMIQWREIRALLRHRAEGTIFLLTLAAVTLLGLEAGMLVAALASVAVFVAGASRVGLQVSHEDGVERIVVRGNLSYASIDALAQRLRAHPAGRTALDLRGVPYCDATAHATIERIRREREGRGGTLEVMRG